MKIGITELCIPGTIDEVTAKAKAWGYEALELAMNAEGGNLNLATPDARKRDIARQVADAGLELASLVAKPVAEHSLLHAEQRVRDEGARRCRQVLDTAALMGADTILLVPGRLVSEVCYDEALRLLVDSLAAIAPHASSVGVHIGLEPVWNKLLVSPMDMKSVIEQVGSSHVGLYMDTGNVVMWNYPEHWIRILGPHIKKIHFKDFKREGLKIAFVPLKQGEVNWPAVMREIRAAGYDGPVISEVGGDAALMAQTAKTMREIVGA